MHIAEARLMEDYQQKLAAWLREGTPFILHNFPGPKEDYNRVANWVRNVDTMELKREHDRPVSFKNWLVVVDKRTTIQKDKSPIITLTFLINGKDKIYSTGSGSFTEMFLTEVYGNTAYDVTAAQTVIPFEKKTNSGNRCLIMKYELQKGLFE